MFETYVLSGTSLTLKPGGNESGNQIIIGVPTPDESPTPVPWIGTLVTMANPVGVAYSPVNGGWWAVLDSKPALSPGVAASGSASLYMSQYNFALDSNYDGWWYGPHENYTNSYGGDTFVTPRSLAADSFGDFYVADAGQSEVLMFGTGDPTTIISPPWTGSWDGSTTSKPFIKPIAVACDTSNDVFVADAGYSPSVVQEYAMQGTTILGNWNLTSGCVVNGLAVDSAGDFYVSDIGNSEVEEYKIASFSTANLVRAWTLPTSMVEFATFKPSCIQLIGSYILVGDADPNNNEIQVFGP